MVKDKFFLITFLGGGGGGSVQLLGLQIYFLFYIFNSQGHIVTVHGWRNLCILVDHEPPPPPG